MRPTIAVAVSGGVDSLMSAHLLKQSGYRVFGLHFITGFETEPAAIDTLSDQLGIRIDVVDIRNEFKQRVVDYFTATYEACRTPNPCLVCNPTIKFGVLYDMAEKKGAAKLATGHYARVRSDDQGRFHLHKGVDSKKDQAYFLAFLTQRQLSRACFPLGKYSKEQVKMLAAQKGLRPITAQESQDVCFIKGPNYSDFLTSQTGIKSQPGDIVNKNGTVVGRHDGLHRFTIGQRRGINCPASEPYYVLRIDRDNNQLVVGGKHQLLSDRCRVDHVNWIQPPASDAIRVLVKVRYRHAAVPATVHPDRADQAAVHFDAPEAALTPGQGAVFYDGDEVLGGGFIA